MGSVLRPVKIGGTGYYVPEKVVTNQELIDRYKMDTTDEWIRAKLGMVERRHARLDQQTSDLSVIAARQAMETAGVKPEQIGGLICALGYGDRRAPATACIIQEKLGTKNAFAVDVMGACAGFIVGVEMGRHMVAQGWTDAFLVIGADIASRYKVDNSDRLMGVLFGDGAGAAVLVPGDENHRILGGYLRSDGSGAQIMGIATGGSECETTYASVDRGDHFLKMDGKGVWNYAMRGFPDAVRGALKAAGRTPAEIDFVITHQANLNLIKEILKELGFSLDKTFTTVEKYANTSSASAAITLAEAVEKGFIREGMTILVAALGAGFTWGAQVIRW
ncbi:MAG: 3-oxoacyl-[acyl-carrier-protein] synthase 3 [Myxococcota bacterium]|nr:3-oxoacyl-[acyl-carrier-protein] synthase 3 [Myxococcota bacterium]